MRGFSYSIIFNKSGMTTVEFLDVLCLDRIPMWTSCVVDSRGNSRSSTKFHLFCTSIPVLGNSGIMPQMRARAHILARRSLSQAWGG